MEKALQERTCLIFDFDGTLVDSMWIWEELDLELLHSFGKEPDDYARKMIPTMNIKEASRFFAEYFQIPKTPEEICLMIEEKAEDFYQNRVQLKPHAREFLEMLKKQGKHMCIATSSARSYVESFVNANGLGGYFDFLIAAGDVTKGKTEPEIYDKCLAQFGCEKGDAIVFEDALYAIETAKKAGYFVCAVEDDLETDKMEQIEKIADAKIVGFSHLL